MATMRPKPGNNDWLGTTVTLARLQVIGDDDKWQTVGSCIDAPNAITKELQQAKYQGRDIWVRDAFGGRRYHGHIN